MLDFESALARAEARAGRDPGGGGRSHHRGRLAGRLRHAELVRGGLRAGTPAIPLVRMLTERVRAHDAAAAGFVHWGATSQDVTDTALVLLLARCRHVLEADHHRLTAALRTLSDAHAGTVMLGRTLLQAAPPVTFGLKAAGWLASLRRGWERVASRFDEVGVSAVRRRQRNAGRVGRRGASRWRKRWRRS